MNVWEQGLGLYTVAVPGAQALLKKQVLGVARRPSPPEKAGTGGSLKKFRLKGFRFRTLHCSCTRRPSPPEKAGTGGSLKKFRFRAQDLKIFCGVDCGGCAGKKQAMKAKQKNCSLSLL